ncbi:MAG: hypothetical protein ABIN69_16755 [Aestuariivirga sp.]|jgi:PDZ domain-containing secreted protein
MKLLTVVAATLAMTAHAYAWDGVNVDTGTSISIEEGSELSEGNTLDAIDDESGDQFQIVINTVSQIDGGTEIEVTNTSNNQNEIYDFQDPGDDEAPQ